MIKPVFHVLRHSVVLGLEIFGAFLLLGAALVALVMWRFSEGPIDLTFAGGYVSSALVEHDHDTNLKFASIMATWPDFHESVNIEMRDVVLVDQGKTVLSAPKLQVKISRSSLLIGMIRPKEVVVDGAVLRLTKTQDGKVHLLLGEGDGLAQSLPAEPSVNTAVPLSLGLRDLGESFFQGEMLADYPQLEPLSALKKLSVRHGRMIFDDRVSGASWTIPDIDMDVARKRREFSLVLNYQHAPEKKSALAVHLAKDQLGVVAVDVDIRNVSPGTFLPFLFPRQKLNPDEMFVTGHVRGALNKDWGVEVMDSELSSDAGTLKIQGLDDVPIVFSKLSGNIHYEGTQKILSVRDTWFDINGRTVTVDGQKVLGAGDPLFPLHIRIPEITLSDIHTLWPEALKGTVLADWMTRRLSGGLIKNFDMMVPVNVVDVTQLDPENIVASLDFQNLDVDYQAPMIPLKNSQGHAAYAKDRLDVQVDAGHINGLNVHKATVSIEHLAHPTVVGDVVIDAKVSGGLAPVLEYIATEPLLLSEDKTGLSAQEVRGSGDFTAHIVFPALKDLLAKDVKVGVDATLTDIKLPHIIKGLDLTGGPFALKVDAGAFTIDGDGKIGGENLDLVYQEYINRDNAPYHARIVAKVNATPKLRSQFGVDIDDFVADALPVTVLYQSDFSGNENVGVKADLKPVLFRIPPLKFMKAAGLDGSLSCDVALKKSVPDSIQNIVIDLGGLGKASGYLDLGAVGKNVDVRSGKFPSVTLGGKNNFSFEFSRKDGDVIDVHVRGKRFDVRNFLGGTYSDASDSSGDSSFQSRVAVDVEKMITGDASDQVILAPRFSLATNKAGDVTYLDLSGDVGGGDISVSLKPDSKGAMKLNVSSSNAGRALHVLGIYDQIRSGTLMVQGTQIAGAGVNDIRGHAQVSNFTVVKAPVLAKLINLFSISGLADLLQNQGIAFDSMKVDYDWKKTSAGQVISLRNGRTSGASIGLTFGGYIYQDKGEIDLSGNFVPMSQINGVLSKIPLLGSLLTGGKGGGIIAATYSVKGRSDDPRVVINPLSVLTPGFLRSIFFEGSPELEKSDDNSSAPRKSVKSPYNN